MNNKIRVALCDDHPVIRYGLSHMLSSENDIDVIGEASSHQELLDLFEKQQPDVTVLDLELGDSSGLDCLRTIRQKYPGSRILIYTSFGESDRIMEAVEINVQGYLLKQSDCTEIIKAIRIVNNGGTCLQPEVATKLLAGMRDDSKPLANILSKREYQVLSLMAMGKTNKDIADTLFISERTVKFHVSAILEKLEVRNRTEAALLANQHHINSALPGLAHA